MKNYSATWRSTKMKMRTGYRIATACFIISALMLVAVVVVGTLERQEVREFLRNCDGTVNVNRDGSLTCIRMI